MNCPDWMIHQSVRYCLGRRSYAVSECTEWLIENWPEIPENTRSIIMKDIEMQIDMDERVRGRTRDGEEVYQPLGDNCDRRRWLNVAELWRENK